MSKVQSSTLLWFGIISNPRLLIPYKVYIPKVYIPCIPWLRITRGKQGIKCNLLLFHSRSSSSSIGSPWGSLSSTCEHGVHGTQFSSYVRCQHWSRFRCTQLFGYHSRCTWRLLVPSKIKLLNVLFYGTVRDSFDWYRVIFKSVTDSQKV